MSAKAGLIDRIEGRWRRHRLGRRLAGLGRGSAFQAPGPFVLGGERIAVGASVFGRPFIRLEALPSARSPASGHLITIDDNAYLGFHLNVFATMGVRIGRHAYLNGHVTIYDHYPPLEGGPVEGGPAAVPAEDAPAAGEVIIGDRAWLGWGAVVLPGVRIGTHAVLGANSVATRSIPDRAVAVGNPAVVVRRYDERTGAWREAGPGEGA